MTTPRPRSSARAKKVKRWRARRRTVRRLWALAGVLLATGVVWATALFIWALAPGPGPGKRVVLEIPGGTQPSELGALLYQHQLLNSPRMFSLYLETLGRGVTLQPGMHVFNDALSPRELTQRLGRLKIRPTRKVTIVEGFDLWQVAERLEVNEICSATAFVTASFNPAYLNTLELSDSAEGYLFPATYDFKEDSDPRVALYTLVREAKRRFAEVFKSETAGYERLKGDLGFDERSMVTLASMVEKEAAREEERALIAGVFLNRLTDPNFQPRQVLQSDPTAAYGCRRLRATIPSCAAFGGKITPAMLRDPLNPYNTYTHPGLPPGPISNPGLGSLKAVLRPAETDYLYFVAVGGGRHAFSRTYAEHQRAYAPNPSNPTPPAAPPIAGSPPH